MTFDPRRDRRDQIFARSVIAEATRRNNDDTYQRGITNFFARHEGCNVGGHPDASEVDADVERCIWCVEEPVSEEYTPYCSSYCAVQAEMS